MLQNDPIIKTGISQKTDAMEAVQELYGAIYQPDISFAVFYCSSSYDIQLLEKALAEKFADIPLIGCTTAGEITPDGFRDNSITGFTICSEDINVESALISLDDFTATDAVSAYERLSKVIAGEQSSNDLQSFMMLMVDGVSGMEERVVGALHEAAREVPLVGGSAADGENFEQTFVYYQGEFHRNSAVLTLVCTSLPFVTFKTENFIDNGGNKMVVTEADIANRMVTEIDGLTAVEGYAELFNTDKESLTLDFFATHPIAVKLGDQLYVRSITAFSTDVKVAEVNGLKFACAIDEGIVLTAVDEVDILEDIKGTFDEVRAQIGEPILTLGFDCLYRKQQYALAKVKSEVGQVMRANNVIGFHTYGEQFGPLHVNQTFSAVAFGKVKR